MDAAVDDAQRSSRYEKLPGCNTTRGGQFEYGMASLLFLRSLNRTEHFQLGCNLNGLGLFDDVYLRCCMDEKGKRKVEVAFIQLKHKEKESGVSVTQLVSEKGNFSVYQYFKSYCTIMKIHSGEVDISNSHIIRQDNLEDFNFIIFTNNFVKHRSKSLQFNQLSSLEKALCTGGQDQEVFSFGPEDENVWSLRKNKDDNEMYQKFLQRLRIFSRQRCAEQLIKLVSDEVYNVVSTSHPDDLSSNFVKNMETWWNNSNTLITELSELWYKPLRQTLNKYLVQYLHNVSFQFRPESSEFLEIYWDNHTFINIVVPEVDHEVRCLKLFALLESKHKDRYLLLNQADIENLKELIVYISKQAFCQVLVINIKNVLNVKHLIQDLSPSECRVLLVSGVKLSSRDTPFSHHEDRWSVADLTLESQKRLYGASIYFQGETVRFADLGPRNIIYSLNPLCLNIIFKGDKITVGSPVPQPNTIYITRTLRHQTVLRDDVLRDSHDNDIFVVSRLPVIRSSDIGLNTIILSRDNGTSMFTSGEIQRYRAEYLDLCEKFKSSRSVHWVSYEEGLLVWKESAGSVETPCRYIDRLNDHCQGGMNCYHEEEDMTMCGRKLLLITGDPGIGKSSLLRHVAQRVKNEKPHSWTIHVSLSDFSKELNATPPDNITLKDVCNILEIAADLSNSTRPTLGKKLLNYSLKSKGNIVLFLDAVDEVCPTYEQQVLKIIQHLLTTKISGLWVTSRTTLQNFLQKELLCVSLTLQPLTGNQQNQLLTQLVTQCSVENNSRNQTAELLRLIRWGDNLSSGRNFFDVPLYLSMVADIIQEFRRDISDYSDILKELNVYRIYESFIRKKLDIFYDKCGIDKTKTPLIEFSRDIENKLMNDHMACALKGIFHPSEIKILNYPTLEEEAELAMQGKLERAGIITSFVDDKPQFVHRTFCEFFVAKWYKALLDRNRHLLRNDTQSLAHDAYGNASDIVSGKVRSILHLSSGNTGRTLRKSMKLLYTKQLDQVRLFLDLMLSEGFPLHQSVLLDRVEELPHVVESVNIKDNFGRLPLHLAVIHRNLNLIPMLLSFGSQINTQDNILGWTPLKYADRMQAWDIALQLLLRGARIKDAKLLKRNFGSWDKLREIISENEKSKRSIRYKPCDKPSALVSAVKTHNIPLIQMILQGKIDIHGTDSENNTALIVAVRRNSFQLVHLLLSHGLKVNAENVEGNTALMIAAGNCNNNIIKILLNHGSDVNYSNKKGETALIYAASSIFSTPCVQLLLEHGANVHATDNDGNTALMRAAERGNEESCAKSLLNYGSYINYGNNKGETALIYAASNMLSVTCVQLLLEHGADVHATDSDGNTALIKVIKRGNQNRVKTLLDHGSNVNHSNKEGETALLCAVSETFETPCLQLLLEYGADLHATGIDGNTALMRAAKRGDEESVKTLLNYGSNVNYSNKERETALLCAASSWFNTACVQLLLEHCADIHAKNNDGNTALMRAAKQGNEERVNMLLLYGSNVNCINEKGETALHCASYCNNAATCVALLLEHGVDIHITDKDGNTALKIAVMCSNDNIIEALLSRESKATLR